MVDSAVEPRPAPRPGVSNRFQGRPSFAAKADPVGDAVLCQRIESNAEDGHRKLLGVTLNGQQVGASWFIYPPHWDAREDPASVRASPSDLSTGELEAAPVAVG
jgi:hypothetical protein